jgi:hypothetical protein
VENTQGILRVNYKILHLKFSEKPLFSIDPPISAHALLSGSFGSIIELSVKYSKEGTETLYLLKIGNKVVEVE